MARLRPDMGIGSLDTVEDANRVLALLTAYWRVVHWDLDCFIATARPGEPFDADTNMITYWPPEQIRARFEAACATWGIPAQTVIELKRLGKEGRMRLIERLAPLLGLSTAGRHKVETFERELVETPLGAAWVLARISNDTDGLRRLGAIPAEQHAPPLARGA